MNQLRFNIGVPRGGSAARIAEEAAEPTPRSVRPLAGSAARDAEERKRVDVLAPRFAAIRLRAQGARVAEWEDIHRESDVVRFSGEASHQAQTVSVERAGQVRPDLPPNRTSDATFSPSTAVPEQVVEESASSRPLQTAAVSIKSLVQSLFSLGVSSSKS